MATFLHGIFKDKDETVILVEIHSSLGSGDITIGEENQQGQIYFSEDPIEIITENEDLNSHIIKKTCTISLVTSIYLGDILFAANEKSIEVEIFKDTNCIFSGYVEPYTYTQPWAYALEEITLNCVDKLCCLQYEYFLDDKTWEAKKAQNNVLSFHDYISMILPTSTYWDKSKMVDSKSVFETAGVSMNVFLGKSQDDVWNNEKILEEILKYCNLHVIQEGRRFYIFDWNNIGIISAWYNIYDGNVIMKDTTPITIDNTTISSDDTNLSMSDVYNQIVLKCELEEKEDLISSPLESDDIQSYSDVKQMFYSEYIGEGSGSFPNFADAVSQGYAHPENIENNGSDWYRQDWYFKWMYNPSWQLYYHGKPISNWLKKDANGKYIEMHRILAAMQQNAFMPALLWVGKNENKINRQRKSRLNAEGKPTGSINGKNYLVISVNGDYDNTETRLSRYDDDLYYATHDDAGTNVGLLQFKGESGIFSPTDDDTTNYIIFNGSMVLNPPRIEAGNMASHAAPYKTFNTVYNDVHDLVMWPFTAEGAHEDIIDNSGDYHYLAQQFWTCQNAADIEQPNNSALMIYPYSDTPKVHTMEYNYSDHGDQTDKIDKLSLLECELRIGDKYLVEIETGDRQKPAYRWLTLQQCPTIDGVVKKTFSLGFDPLIDDPIIGKEYELANTVNGRYSNEKGTAIPITKADALSGDVEFKILGLYNSQWNYITRRHPTMFRHTKYYDNWKNVLSYISSIWIKDFNIKIISDNNGYDVSSHAKDLVYISDEADKYIKKKDDITFKINTMPTTNELISIGISTNVSNTNVVNMNTKQPLTEITDLANNETDRAERLYVNEYYNMYCLPKVIVNTSLKYNNTDYFFKLYNFAGFGTLMPFKIDYSLKTAEVKITCRQK